MTEKQFKLILKQALAETEERLVTRMDDRFSGLEERLKDQDLRFNAFADAVGERFVAIDTRLNSIDGRLETVETKLDTKADGSTMYEKLTQISHNF